VQGSSGLSVQGRRQSAAAKYEAKTQKGSKGEDRWLGLYTIVELSTTTCILKNALGQKLKTRINRSQLKPYLQTSQSDNKHANPTESDSELTCQSEPDKPSDYESENET